MRIAIDVDDVIADLLPEWLGQYNLAYQDELKITDLTEWDMVKFVKPECGNHIYRFLNPENRIYDKVKPVEGAIAGVRLLNLAGYEVVFVTAGINESKADWMIRHGFIKSFRPLDEGFIIASNKSLIDADLIIDDKALTCIKWPYPRKALLFGTPQNEDAVIPERVTRVEGWNGVLEHLGLKRGVFHARV